MAEPLSPLTLFNQGKLTEALTAAAEAVGADPTSTARRWTYCELLCFKGDFDRADKHLDLIVTQEPDASTRAWGFRQLLRAGEARQQFFESGRVPEFLADPNPELKSRVRAAVCLRESDTAGANQAMTDAAAAHQPIAGVCNEESFTDLLDLDDRIGPMFESLTVTGKYYLMPMYALEWIAFEPPKRILDLLWRKGKFLLRGSTEPGEALFPALYAGSEKDADDAIRTGRETRWNGGAGLGRRDFRISQSKGDSLISIMEVSRITFTAPA